MILLDTAISAYTEEIDGGVGAFLKCFYLKEDYGVFVYYLTKYDYGPKIKVIRIKDDNNVEEKFDALLNFTEYRFNTEPILSDLTKINNTRFSYWLLHIIKQRFLFYYLIFIIVTII